MAVQTKVAKFGLQNLTSLRVLWKSPRMYIHSSPSCLKKMSEEYKSDQPIKYSTSKAYDYSSFDTFQAPKRDWPWYQAPILIVSTAIFLVYFGILREENDLDEELTTSLYLQVPGLEEAHIRGAIEYERQTGKDVSELESRLKEIIAEKKIAGKN